MIYAMRFFIFILPIFILANDDFGSVIESYRKSEGIAVGVFEDGHEKVYTYGTLSRTSNLQITESSEFRIGGLTKLFTATLLAYVVELERADLNDPVVKFLAKSVKLPTYKGTEITFLDLATNTSGLPDDTKPRNEYDVKDLYNFLAHTHLNKRPGKAYQPSDIGYVLLANVLLKIMKTSYPILLKQAITIPHDLSDTSFFLRKDQKLRMVTGYQNGVQVGASEFEKAYSVFVPVSGLKSTLKDLSKFLKLLMGDSKLANIVNKPYVKESALAWMIADVDRYYLSTQCTGFSGYMGMIKGKKSGVIILVNDSSFPVDKLGEKLMGMINGKDSDYKSTTAASRR